jgi:hypothetical protein
MLQANYVSTRKVNVFSCETIIGKVILSNFKYYFFRIMKFIRSIRYGTFACPPPPASTSDRLRSAVKVAIPHSLGGYVPTRQTRVLGSGSSTMFRSSRIENPSFRNQKVGSNG